MVARLTVTEGFPAGIVTASGLNCGTADTGLDSPSVTISAWPKSALRVIVAVTDPPSVTCEALSEKPSVRVSTSLTVTRKLAPVVLGDEGAIAPVPQGSAEFQQF